MVNTSVIFAFRDRIAFLIADCAAKALRNEADYREYCSLPKLTDTLGVTPVQMNLELQTLVARGYVTIQDEIAFPTWKTLKMHPTFKGVSVEEAQAIIKRLRAPTGSVSNLAHE